MADWRTDVLKGLGAPVTKQNVQFLSTWQRWEGGHTHNDARFNWLNTTSSAPGAVRSINSVGVKAFDTYENGVGATIQTLNNGRYSDILDALRDGDPYRKKPVKGLSVWLSGQPDSPAGARYASKVLGTPVSYTPPARGSKATVQRGGQTYGGGGASPQRVLASSSAESMFKESLAGFMLGRAQARREGRDPQGGFMELAQLRRQYQAMGGVPDQARTTAADPIRKTAGTPQSDVVDGNILVPTVQSGTHVTDNLDWNNGRKTARDIMAKPGTVVGAPEDGTILRHGSAQGGESMYFKGKSGRLYWLGHIDNIIPEGTSVRAGRPLARISADHAAPHLHFDYKL